MDLDLLTVVVVPDESSSYVSHEQNDTTETKLTAAASTRYCSSEPEVAAVPRDIHMDTAQVPVAPSAGTTYQYYMICTYPPRHVTAVRTIGSPHNLTRARIGLRISLLVVVDLDLAMESK